MEPSRNAFRCRKRKAEDTPGASDASALSPLGDALKNEDILLKVLGYVGNDDIRECRRVCRRWYEVCGQVPFANRNDIDLWQLSKLIEKFPNVTDVSLKECSDKIDFLDTLLTFLPKLKRLRTLRLSLHKGHRVPEGLCPILVSMDSLQSLSLNLHDESAFIAWIEILRHLPELLSLKLSFSGTVNTDLGIVSELHRLRDLTCNFRVFVKRDGRLLFPSLNQLTRLKICCSYSQSRQVHVMNLRVSIRQATSFV